MVGPFTVTQTSSVKFTLNSPTLTVKDGASQISYSVCDENGNIISVPNEGTFYLLVSPSVTKLNVDLKLSGTATGTESGAYLWWYKIDGNPCKKDAYQELLYVEQGDYINVTTQTKEVTLSWSHKMTKEGLTIQKKDANTGKFLEGTKIRVTGPVEGGNTYENVLTMPEGSNGSITINNLTPGTYTVRELAAPYGYNSSLQTDVVKTGTTGSIITITNRQYGNLIINKIEKDTGEKLKDVGFNIYTKSGNTNNYISDYKEGSPSSVSYGTPMEFKTNSNGQIILKNIPIGTYYIKEVSVPTSMQEYYGVDPTEHSVNVVNNVKEKETTSDTEIIKKKKYVDITGNINYDNKANLSITTMDYKTRKGIGGVRYFINSKSGYTDILETNSNGKIEVNDIPQGIYTITEISRSDDVSKYYTDDVTTYSIYLTKSNNIEAFNKEITVKQKWVEVSGYADEVNGNANLKIVSKDAKTGELVWDAKYVIYTKDGNKENYITSYKLGPTTSISFGDERNAMKFDSYTQLDDIPFGTYYIKEYTDTGNINNDYNKDPNDKYIVDTTEYSIKLEKREYDTINTEIVITNKQKYVDISGYVWEDVADENKQTLRNDLYEAPETLVKDITVRLKHTDGTTIATTTTGDNGSYKFTKVQISELNNYYIEFEYNGLKYQNVGTNLGASKGSKAVEKNDDRTNFNNSYAEITGGNAKGANTVGYSRNTSGTITNNLTYTNGSYSSSVVQNTGYTVASASEKVTAQNGSTGVVMKADTNTAKYTLNRWTVGVKEITNVNFGICEREQPDIAIATDLDTIGLSLNGYSHTYIYNKRLSKTGIDIFNDYKQWNKTEQQLKDANYPITYTRSIYKNYVYASAITGDGKLDDDKKLQVELTYKIQIKNESSSLYMSANELVNYFDKTLDYTESWLADVNGNKIRDVVWTSKEDKNGYNQIRTTSLKDVKIGHGESIFVYLKMKKNSVISWGTKNELNEKTYNVTEIASYSSFDGDGRIYAGIDRDSAPDNIMPGNVNTYEDDTDSAPVVEFIFDEPRTISGYVFEDYTSSELKTGNERNGDGKYNASQDGYVGNVKVELINVSDDKTSYIYPKAVSESNINAENAEYKTTNEGKGYYEIVGVIPGEYYLKFTYDDGSVIYKTTGEKVNVTTQDYKSTIITSAEMKGAFGNNNFNVNSNPEWYQNNNITRNSYSVAVDDYTTRTAINEKLSKITYKVRTGYENKEEYDKYQSMAARTPNMNIAIENRNGEVTIQDEKRTRVYENFDFGIVERPRQSVEVTKEIKEIKLKLANTQGLVEGDPRTGTINYVTYPKGGDLKIEVDYEIIEGATLEITYEIKVANKSELDYDNEEYYKYGTNSTGAKPVKMTINSVVDYMDENLKTTYDRNEGEWKLTSAKDLFDKGFIAKNVYDNAKNYNNILVNECNLELEPNENKTLASVSASKLLSTAGKMNYKNYAEILIASNDVGRFYGQEDAGSITNWKLISPGSLVTTDATTYEVDDDRVDINIIPPTGDNQNIVIYTVIGISCLSLLVVGIVLIKKKVLD